MRWLVLGLILTFAMLAHTVVRADTPHCVEDFNPDGWIDITDIQLQVAHFGQQNTTYDIALPLDGVVDITDVQKVTSKFGLECGGASGTVAQPATLASADGTMVQTSITCVWQYNHLAHHPFDGSGYMRMDYALDVWCFGAPDPLRESVSCNAEIEALLPDPRGSWTLIAVGSTPFNQGELCTSTGFSPWIPRGKMLRQNNCFELGYAGNIIVSTCKGEEFPWVYQ